MTVACVQLGQFSFPSVRVVFHLNWACILGEPGNRAHGSTGNLGAVDILKADILSDSVHKAFVRSMYCV